MHLHRSIAGRSGEESNWRRNVVRTPEAAARAFYQDLLGGRQVWPTGRRAIGKLHFLFDRSLVEVGPARGDVQALEVAVDSPYDVAARCWDAGFTVRLLASEEEEAIAVIDPFDRAILLRPRRPDAALGSAAGQAG